MSARVRTMWVAPAARRGWGSPSRSMPMRTGTPCSAPRRMSAGLSPVVAAPLTPAGGGGAGGLADPGGGGGRGRHAVVVGVALGAVGIRPEDDLEGVPAFLLEHAVGALGGGAGGEHEGRAAGGELAQDDAGVRVGDRPHVVV